jgi:Flp pilus assembly protein TadG
MVAALLVVVLGVAGLAVDLGRGYIAKSRLSRAVDAGVLAAARSLRLGQSVARQQALAMARANGVTDLGAIDISFGTNGNGESTVSMSASETLPTTLMRLLGIKTMDIGSNATAAIPPVDLVLVLDQSGSLGDAGAWRPLQSAAREFVGNFSDRMDQVGLVSFQIVAANRFMLAHDFTAPIDATINSMNSNGDTNTGEGLRLAYDQLQQSNVRKHSAKVVVFFTDGRPTAFRGLVGPGAPSGGGNGLGPFHTPPGAKYEDRIMAVGTTRTGRMRGYFNNPPGIPINRVANPNGCANATVCWGWTEQKIRQKGIDNGSEVANAIRSGGAYIYTIGLGNRHSSDPLLQPDEAYLRALANQDGVTNPNQPKGKEYFAPDATQLHQVFEQVAQDLLVRLSQ